MPEKSSRSSVASTSSSSPELSCILCIEHTTDGLIATCLGKLVNFPSALISLIGTHTGSRSTNLNTQINAHKRYLWQYLHISIYIMMVILYFRWNKSGQKWPKVVQNGFKWPNMAQNDPKWPKQLKWPKDAQSCPKWPKVAQTLEYLDDPKWPKILASHHSPKNSKNTFFGHPVYIH